VKFIIIQFSPRCLPFFKVQISSSKPCSKNPSFWWTSLKVRDQVSYPYSTTEKITVLYILIFSFFIWDGETKDFGLSNSKDRYDKRYDRSQIWWAYMEIDDGVSKSFRTGRLERELQMAVVPLLCESV
jgi:hypothetical protein